MMTKGVGEKIRTKKKSCRETDWGLEIPIMAVRKKTKLTRTKLGNR